MSTARETANRQIALFLRKLAERRKAAGLTQNELGNRVGVSSQRISDYEAGRSRPGLHQFLALAIALNVRVGEWD